MENQLVDIDTSPRLIGLIVHNDATAILIDSDSSPEILDAEEIAWLIRDAIESGE